MENIKEINIKNRTYYFYDDMINIKNFDSALLKNGEEVIQKYWYLLHWIYHKKDKYVINNVNLCTL